MCAKAVAKFVLIIFNIVFFFLGAILLGLGIYVVAGKSHLLKAFGNIPDDQKDVLEAVNAPSLLENAAYGLIGAGAFIFLLAFFGCCGAIKEIRVFLIIYAVIVSIIVVIQIAMVIVTVSFKKKVEENLQKYMKKTITEAYIGLTIENNKPKLPEDVISMTWDYVQLSAQCCGAVNYKEYENASKWPKKYNMTVNNKLETVSAKVPLSCCKVTDESKIDPENIANVKFVDMMGCLKSPEDTNANLNGCYEAVKDNLENYADIALYVGLGTALVEIMGIIAACWLFRKHGEYKAV